MGGFNGRTRLNSAERYDPVLNQWTLIAPMNMMRSDANAAALSDKVISNNCYTFPTVCSYPSAISVNLLLNSL